MQKVIVQGELVHQTSKSYLLLLVMHVPTALLLQMQPSGLKDATVHLTTLCCLKVTLSKSYHYVKTSHVNGLLTQLFLKLKPFLHGISLSSQPESIHAMELCISLNVMLMHISCTITFQQLIKTLILNRTKAHRTTFPLQAFKI